MFRIRDTLEPLHEEHRLLAILRTLLRSPGYASNLALLCDHLDALGLVTSHDLKGTDVHRLKEMGLCSLGACNEFCRATLTERGVDVAEGTSEVEGIRGPGPECPY